MCLPRNWAFSAHKRITAWAAANDKLSALAATVEQAANALNSAPHLIDYHRRRQALRTWSIPPQDWRTITEPLRLAEKARSTPASTDWGDRKRRVASTLVWKMITCGDHTVAPLFRGRAGTPTERFRFLRIVLKALHVHANGPDDHAIGAHFQSLTNALDSYIRQLTTAIDNRAATPSN